MRVRQPGVNRKQRYLDTEGECKSDKESELGASGQRVRRKRLQKRWIVKRVIREVKREDADQHQEASYCRVDKKLHRGVDAALTTPDSDQEEHRDQRRFEE